MIHHHSKLTNKKPVDSRTKIDMIKLIIWDVDVIWTFDEKYQINLVFHKNFFQVFFT